MHELACPSCNAPSQFELKDYLLMCPFCSTTFELDLETGKKDIHTDHYIIPNTLDSRQLKSIVLQWIKRLHHNPENVENEYFITEMKGYSVPFWIISLEAHTLWKGLVKRHRKKKLDHSQGSNFIVENGQFRRNYRWAISARKNLCETWGMTSLHEPKESIDVDWDGFPLDSTFSRGRVDPTTGVRTSKEKGEEELSAYEVREFFEFKYSNGLPIMSIEVGEEEALRRAKQHIEFYHYKIAKLNVDVPIDIRSELEIAGIQLIHLPFWHIFYIYKPRGLLRHFQRAKEKNLILEGYSGGVLKGELGMIHKDKLWINVFVSIATALVTLILSIFWHPAFFFVSLFLACIGAASAYIATNRRSKNNETSSFFYVSEDEEATVEKPERI